MYKVFVNEKSLSLTEVPNLKEEHIKFDGIHSLEKAINLLENTNLDAINVYSEDLAEIWINFKTLYKQIEASGGIVYNTKNEILFIHRLGKWDLPKGKLEKGESLDENAVREVEEETGLKDLILDQLVGKTYHTYVEKTGQKILKKTNWFKMFYKCKQIPVPQIEEGITEVAWKNQEKIRQDVLPNTFKNITLILNETEKLEHF